MEKKISDLEVEVAEIKKDIERLHDTDDYIKDSLKRHRVDINLIDKALGRFDMNIELIQQRTEFIQKMLSEIQGNLKRFEEERITDHLKIPLENKRRVIQQITQLIIAFLIGILLNALFNLGG